MDARLAVGNDAGGNDDAANDVTALTSENGDRFDGALADPAFNIVILHSCQLSMFALFVQFIRFRIVMVNMPEQTLEFLNLVIPYVVPDFEN